MKLAEREAAERAFRGSRKPAALKGSGGTAGDGEVLAVEQTNGAVASSAPRAAPTEEQVAQIRLAIGAASSLDEVQKLEAVYILHPTSYILHLTSYILHLTSYILHLTSYCSRRKAYHKACLLLHPDRHMGKYVRKYLSQLVSLVRVRRACCCTPTGTWVSTYVSI